MMARREGAERDWTKPRSIRVPDDVWEAAKAEAAERDETVSDAVVQFLRRYGSKRNSEVLNRLPQLSCEQLRELALHQAKAKMPGYVTGRIAALSAAEETNTRPINLVRETLAALDTYRQLPTTQEQIDCGEAVQWAYLAE